MLTIVSGPPCAGKSTYITEHATTGDIVIDLDRIALALTTDDTAHHDYPDHIRAIARRARITAIDAAISMCRNGATAWIIDANPTTQQINWYQRRGAQFVYLNPDADTLRERIAKRPARNQALIATLRPDLDINTIA